MNQTTRKHNNSIFTSLFLSLLVTELLSSLGQVTLTFALPLHLLNISGSATLYGLVTAWALIPTVLLTPIGGALADRLNKQRTMATLDFLTALSASGYLLAQKSWDITLVTIAVMMVVYGLHAIYTPTVQASVPFVLEQAGHNSNEQITQATALITQVTSLTNMLGPVVAGLLLGFVGIIPVVAIASLTCLGSSLWIALAVRIPHQPAARRGEALLTSFAHDLAQAGRYLAGQSNLLVVNVLIAILNFVFCSFLNVALPYIVTQQLSLSNQLQGLAEGVISAGGLAGAILVAVRPAFFTLYRSPYLLVIGALCLLPIAASLTFGLPALTSYLVLTTLVAVVMGIVQCVSVALIGYEQAQTPDFLLGKVIGLTMCLASAAMPLGQAIYGPIIDHFPMPAVIIAVVALTVLLALIAQHIVRQPVTAATDKAPSKH